MCKKAVALRDEFFAPLHVIEEFAVVDHENTLIFVCHRLLTLGQVDDAQPPRGEGNSAAFQKSFLIRSPVMEGARHSLHHPFRCQSLSPQIYDSCDTAHDLYPNDQPSYPTFRMNFPVRSCLNTKSFLEQPSVGVEDNAEKRKWMPDNTLKARTSKKCLAGAYA